MFNKHVLKVIIGFCGMITFGLVSLVIIDSFKLKNQESNAVVNTYTPVPATPKTEIKAKTPVKKSTQTKPTQR